MPYKPKTPCKHPGCARLTDNKKYCDEHLKLHSEVIRSASKCGYSSRWQNASKGYLHEHPLCTECLKPGKYTQATVVDHIIPHRGDMGRFQTFHV